MNASLAEANTALATGLASLLGEACVITDLDQLAYYSSDVYSRGTRAALAIRPRDRQTLPKAIRLITRHGFAITPRSAKSPSGSTAARTRSTARCGASSCARSS